MHKQVHATTTSPLSSSSTNTEDIAFMLSHVYEIRIHREYIRLQNNELDLQIRKQAMPQIQKQAMEKEEFERKWDGILALIVVFAIVVVFAIICWGTY